MLGLLCEAGDAGSIDPPPTLLSTMRAGHGHVEDNRTPSPVPRPPLQLRCAALLAIKGPTSPLREGADHDTTLPTRLAVRSLTSTRLDH
jgi:hypothetical protein